MIAEQTTYAPFTTTTLTTTKTTPEKATATPSTTLSSTSVAAHQQRPQENLGCPGCPLYNGGNCYECCNRLGRGNVAEFSDGALVIPF
ncbi:hypothetical protein BV898_15021 [Hypsibius exemplaris]|uniref:Uncharacterized protein n=1 Tax=Hypsibius exemplaris TaxID=2072580 RepID=A0A9X6RJV1_HYPEX|nr:hypothetical protein BV898_15021 [Hypsibius exemplaris]